MGETPQAAMAATVRKVVLDYRRSESRNESDEAWQ